MESALAARRPGIAPAARARLTGIGWESWLVGLLFSLYCWLLAPVTSDLAAATFRSDLFDATGDLIYSGQWYGGHHLPAYSVLSPTLGALLGTRLLGALSTFGSVVVFERIVVPRYGKAGRVGALLFALTAGSSLLIGRIPFGLGVFLGLIAVSLATRSRWVWACVFAVLSALGSPLAGLFVALGAVAWALLDRRRWIHGLALALCGVVPALFLQWAFREGGTFPYGWGSFAQLLVFCILCLLVLPRDQRVLRVWVLLFLALGLFAQLVPSPLGGNVNRFATIFGAPVLACVLWERRRLAFLAVLPYMIWWPLHDVWRDIPNAGGASTKAAYYAPLRAALARLPGPARIEIPPTRNHWEGVYVGEHVELARGWERQLDQKYNALFYGTEITPARYRHWLTHNAVSYVALADAPSDFASQSEAAAIRAGMPFLQQVWRNRHWRLYVVRGATPLVSGPGSLVNATPDSFTIAASRPGRFLVRLHYSQYWKLLSGSGCVEAAPGNWTRVTLRRAGVARIGISFAPGRLANRGPRCS